MSNDVYIRPFDFQVVEEKDRPSTIYIWGHNDKNENSVALVTGFPHFAYFELPSFLNNRLKEWTPSAANAIGRELKERYEDKGLIASQFIRKKKLYYYRKDKTYPFLLLAFDNKANLTTFAKQAEKGLTLSGDFRIKFKVWEAEIPYITKMLVQLKLTYASWIKFKGDLVEPHKAKTYVKNEYHVEWTELSKSDKEFHVEPSILSYDIETYSDIPNKFPDKNCAKDVAYLITIDFKSTKGERSRYALLYGDTLEPKSGKLIKYKTETDLIAGFAQMIRELDPDVITGYNINGFDWPYLNTRLTRMFKEWPEVGRIKGRLPTFFESNWESRAHGRNVIEYLSIDGRINIDLMPVIKKDYRLAKYTLNYVAQELIKANKHDVTAKEMFAIYKRLKNAKTEEELEAAKKDMYKVIEYALQDANLVIELIEKLSTWGRLVEMSDVTYVTIGQLITRGQQIRCDSQIYKEASSKGFVVDKSDTVSQGYKGGAVEAPIQGMHKNIICLDFASLYPSIIIAYNISYETLVPPDMWPYVGDSECNTIEFEQEEQEIKDDDEGDGEEDDDGEAEEEKKTKVKKSIKKVKYKYKFMKQPMGVLPCLLTGLINKRSETREELKKKSKEECKTEEEKKMKDIRCKNLDNKQLAIKIAANSIYGFLGVGNGALRPLTEGARCVTAIGRQLIGKAGAYLKEKYNARIIYGDTDSVMFDIGITDRKVANAKGRELAVEISKIFPPPLRMEFEKAMDILCFKKKKYAASLIKDDGSIELVRKDGQLNLLTRGILIVRRDNFKLVRDIYAHILLCIFEGKSLKHVLEYLETKIEELYANKIKPEDLAIIKSVAASYKSDTYPMKVLSDNLKADGKPVQPGERIEYLIVKKEGVTKTGPRMRSLEQYYERKEEIDFDYYLKALKNPINQLISIGYKEEIKKFTHIQDRRTSRCKFVGLEEPITIYMNNMWRDKKVVKLSSKLEKAKDEEKVRKVGKFIIRG